MRIGIRYGRDQLNVEVRDESVVAVHGRQPPPPLADPALAVRDALEAPQSFPPLRRALTPDDHVVVVLDEHLPHFVELLTPILEHIASAGVAAEAITLLSPRQPESQAWLEQLPEAFQEVRLEVHDPADRRHLSYLATMKRGRRLYLNRTVVDADQVVVLSGRGYDPVLGYGGAEGALYPTLSDEATQQEMLGQLSLELPGEGPSPLRQEAREAAWLLGAPFLVQVIEGSGEDVAGVLAGLTDTSDAGRRLFEERWRVTVDQRADIVVAAVGGAPERHDFADLARALACAARVVQPGGRIVLLTQATPALGTSAELLRQTDDPGQALAVLHEHKLPDTAAAFLWARAAQQAHIYLLSGLSGEAVEELFATPLEHAGQVQRLLSGTGSCLVLPDADKLLASAESPA